MALAEHLIDNARRKLGLPQWKHERQDATETVLNVIDAALEQLRITTSTDEGADNTETAQHYIEQAMGLLGKKDPDESATSNELSDGTELLDAMLQGWIGEGVYLPNYTALTASSDAVTVPKTAETAVIYNLATYMGAHYGVSAPQEVVQIAVNTQNRMRRDPSSHMDTLNRMAEEWEATGIKLGWSKVTATSDTMPVKRGAIEPIIHNLAIRIAPEYDREVPETVVALAGQGKVRLKRDEDDDIEALNYLLMDWQGDGINLGFQTVRSLGQRVDIPATAERAVVSNLAIELAPEYQVQTPAEVAQAASETKARLRRNSMEPLISDLDHLPGRRRSYDIDTIN